MLSFQCHRAHPPYCTDESNSEHFALLPTSSTSSDRLLLAFFEFVMSIPGAPRYSKSSAHTSSPQRLPKYQKRILFQRNNTPFAYLNLTGDPCSLITIIFSLCKRLATHNTKPRPTARIRLPHLPAQVQLGSDQLRPQTKSATRALPDVFDRSVFGTARVRLDTFSDPVFQ